MSTGTSSIEDAFYSLQQAYRHGNLTAAQVLVRQHSRIEALPEKERLAPVKAALAFGQRACQDSEMATDEFIIYWYPHLLRTLPEADRLVPVNAALAFGQQMCWEEKTGAGYLPWAHGALIETLPEKNRPAAVRNALAFTQQAYEADKITADALVSGQGRLIRILPESEQVAAVNTQTLQTIIDTLAPADNQAKVISGLYALFNTLGSRPTNLGIDGVSVSPRMGQGCNVCVVFERITAPNGSEPMVVAELLIAPLGKALNYVREIYPDADNPHRKAYEAFLGPFVRNPAAPAAA